MAVKVALAGGKEAFLLAAFFVWWFWLCLFLLCFLFFSSFLFSLNGDGGLFVC